MMILFGIVICLGFTKKLLLTGKESSILLPLLLFIFLLPQQFILTSLCSLQKVKNLQKRVFSTSKHVVYFFLKDRTLKETFSGAQKNFRTVMIL